MLEHNLTRVPRAEHQLRIGRTQVADWSPVHGYDVMVGEDVDPPGRHIKSVEREGAR